MPRCADSLRPPSSSMRTPRSGAMDRKLHSGCTSVTMRCRSGVMSRSTSWIFGIRFHVCIGDAAGRPGRASRVRYSSTRLRLGAVEHRRRAAGREPPRLDVARPRARRGEADGNVDAQLSSAVGLQHVGERRVGPPEQRAADQPRGNPPAGRSRPLRRPGSDTSWRHHGADDVRGSGRCSLLADEFAACSWAPGTLKPSSPGCWSTQNLGDIREKQLDLHRGTRVGIAVLPVRSGLGRRTC